MLKRVGIKVIHQSRIPELVTLLKDRFEVFAPQEKDKEVVFSEVSDPGKIVLHYQTTVLPPKTFFLPPKETLFTVKGKKVTASAPPKPFVLFGLHLKDLLGICELDEIMRHEPKDSFYFKRRNKAVIIAASGNEVGVPPGGDLVLEKIEGFYRAIAPTKAGQKIASLPVFETRNIDLKPKPKKMSKLDEMLLDSELLARSVEWSRENYPQIWQRLEKLCINCGICTYVCPLCYCFEVEDQKSLDGSSCSRCRLWSACTLPSFAKIAGGHNFRPTVKERYFNWYYHKFVRAYKEFGRAQCVACGRCQKYCPAGIDIENVLGEIVEEFQKAHPKREF
ncbi:hypothetical protein GTO10_01890 [Candidatus Saccharibacteria bacterium]|nr:hypothetical protein [Candidatus Saccharibacteria bacterium]